MTGVGPASGTPGPAATDGSGDTGTPDPTAPTPGPGDPSPGDPGPGPGDRDTSPGDPGPGDPGPGDTGGPGLAVRVVAGEDPPLVVLEGELDMVSADHLDDILHALLAEGPSAVRFDMRHLAFMDSAGVACLLRVARQVPVSLVEPDQIVRRVLAVTGLQQVLPIEEAP